MTSQDQAVQPEDRGTPASGSRGAPTADAQATAFVRPVDPGSVHVLFEPTATRVVLTGEIDAELGPDLLEAADDALSSARPIEVDSHLVTFMDSTGVAFLARLASRAPRRVRLLDPPDLVSFLIETTRIASLLEVVRNGGPDPEAA